MLFPKKQITGLITNAAKTLIKQEGVIFDLSRVKFDVEHKLDPRFGDYSSNVAFALAKAISKSPLQIAATLKALAEAELPENIERIEIAGGGFLNFHFTREYFSSALKMLSKVKAKDFSIGGKQRVIIEYSSPNVAKPMHIGHLRNTILGNALANLYELLGYKVIRWNHLGDWGTQFGKLIVAYKHWGNKEKIDLNPAEELLALYIRFHKETKNNSGLENEAREEFKKLEQGDKENIKLLRWILKGSLNEFNRFYKLLNVRFDKITGESFYARSEMTDKVIDKMKEREILEGSQGAQIVRLDAFNLPPALIQKTDGSTLYLTRELASLEYRLKKFNPKKILYVVGSEQALHFQQLFAIARLFGVDSQKMEHVKYELILGSNGKKFSTREGNLVTAQEIINQAISAASRVVDEKRSDISREERRKIASVVGINALKYFMLKEGRTMAIIFNVSAMLSLRGNSAPYLNYTYARLDSILRKAGRIGRVDTALFEEKDVSLIKKLLAFPDALDAALADSSPNHVATYLFELANEANSFYESTPIIADQNRGRKNARLVLVKEICSILKRGLEILGITTLSNI